MLSALLDRFETALEEGLMKICTMEGLVKEPLSSPDVEEKWDEMIKDYVGDAVENFNDFPQAAIGFASFLGMAVANLWDRDWDLCRTLEYSSYYGDRGFDDMDDHILDDMLKLEPEERAKVVSVLNSCTMACLDFLRHEGFEAQTAAGFYALNRCYSVMFRIGVSIELTRLGYRKEPVTAGYVN